MASHIQPLIDLYEDSKKALARFPITIIITIIGTSLALFMTRRGLDNSTLDAIGHIMLTLIGLFPASITVKLLEERYQWDKKEKAISYGILALIALIFFFTAPWKISEAKEWEMIRVVIMTMISFLSITFVPFLRAEEQNGFWQLTKQLVIRYVLTGIFAGALFMGTSLTLASISFLFDVEIAEEYFARIWIFCVGIIGAWFFLAGVPSNIAELEKEKAYSELLKKFIKFILTPLLAVYTLVLYAYGIKILITGIWPTGDTVYLIAGYVIAGLLTYALAYPLLAQESFAGKVTKTWLIALLPLMILYFTSIGLRINQYGITAERYFVVILGIFYVASAIYLLASKKKNILLVPLLFSVLAIITCYGPLSAHSTSEWSQLRRLEKLATTEGVLKYGKFTPVKISAENENLQEIQSIIHYVVGEYGIESLEKWLTPEAKNAIEKSKATGGSRTGPGDDSSGLQEYLFGISTTITENKISFISTQNPDGDITVAKGYDYVIDASSYNSNGFTIEGVYYISMITPKGVLEIREENGTPMMSVNLFPLLNPLATTANVNTTTNNTTFTGTQGKFKYKITVISARVGKDTSTVQDVSATLLLGLTK